MTRPLLLLTALPLLFLGQPVQANDPAIREAQQRLAALGRYDGEIDGVSSADFRTSVRYFQHDQGLEATGEVDRATRTALAGAAQKQEGRTLVAVPASEGASKPKPVAPPPAPSRPALEPTVAPPPAIPSSTAAADRALLEEASEREEEEEGREAPPRTAASEPLLEGGVYEEADPGTQAEVLRRAESILRRHRLLEGDPDVSRDALFEEALFRYQSAEGLPLSGRLDQSTLAAMRLLPRQEAPVERWGSLPGSERPVEVYRGRVPRSRTSSDPYPGAVRGIPLN